MIKYEFTCPKCGGHTLLEETRHVVIRDYIEIRDEGSGPEIYAKENDPDIDFEGCRMDWFCNECGWQLPVKTSFQLIDYVVDQEIESLITSLNAVDAEVIN